MGRLAWVLAASLALAGSPRAHAAQPVRDAVLVQPIDAELLRRIRGQTSDLSSWAIAVVDAPQDLPGAPSERARAIGAMFRAEVVIWFEPSADGFTVFIADVAHDQLITRRMVRGRASSNREAAAIVVRASLRALEFEARELAQREEIAPQEIAPQEIAPEIERTEEIAQQKIAPQEIERPEEARVIVETKTSTPGASAVFEAMVGWRASVIGVGAPVHAIAARIGVGLGLGLGLGLEVAASFPSAVTDAQSTIEISRHRLSAFAAFDVLDGELGAISAGIDAGAIALRRTTVDVGAGVTAAPASTSWLFAAGLEARARMFVPGTERALAVELAAGAEVVPVSVVFSYADANSAAHTERDRLWEIQPRFGLGLTVRR